jgi:hypothetical protein
MGVVLLSMLSTAYDVDVFIANLDIIVIPE